MIRNPLVALMTGMGLLISGIAVHVEAASEQDQLRANLSHDAVAVSRDIGAYFERARSIDLMLAQTRLTDDAGRFDRARVSEVYRYLEEVLYPGAISEACLINEKGVELARVTNGASATSKDLSSDERDNPFFAPTLRMGRNEVYQSVPYLSQDTHTWVMAQSTWIPSAQGRLIVHFELRLSSLEAAVSHGGIDRHAAVVDAASGRILLAGDPSLSPRYSKSRADKDRTLATDFKEADWSRAAARLGTGSGTIQVDGRTGTFQRVDVAAHNVNRWYVVQWSTGSGGPISSTTGWLLGTVGALMIAVALLFTRRQQRQLRRMAAHDPLTGIANRRGVEAEIERVVDRAGRPVCVLLMDLDGFKQINDTHGHQSGDEVLREIASRLRDNTLESDTVGRLGGDEFVVVLTAIDNAHDAETVAHRLRDALIRPVFVDDLERFVGVSIGVAIAPQHGRSAQELLRNADSAMYEAKRNHGGVKVYEEGRRQEADTLAIAAQLLNAINDDRIELAFQPVYSLADDSVCGAEALARWDRLERDDAGREIVVPEPPGVFIPLAERTGLIRRLTHLTLRKALDEARAWRDGGHPLPVSVNLSAQLVGDATLVDFMSEQLATRGLPGSALVLEVTETAAVADGDQGWPVLDALRALGVRILLDDFGAGHASFGVMRRLPLDGVKIDRDLLADQLHTEAHLLTAAVRVAERFNLEITAEGIEDDAGLELSRRVGSHVAQGYHLARPMSAGAFRDLLQRGERGPEVPAQASPATRPGPGVLDPR